MSNTIGRFDYQLMRGPEDRPFTPIAHITLDHWHTNEGGGISISPQLTRLEVEGYIEQLKADLDAVGARAKQALEKARRRNLQIAKARRDED